MFKMVEVCLPEQNCPLIPSYPNTGLSTHRYSLVFSRLPGRLESPYTVLIHHGGVQPIRLKNVLV